MTEQILPPRLDNGWLREGAEQPSPKTIPVEFAPEKPQLPEFYSEDIAALEKIGSEALARWQTIAEDGRYAFKHKNETIENERPNILKEVESASQKALDRHTKRQAELEKLARLSSTPSPEEIQQLTYVKDMLFTSKWPFMTLAQLLADWDDSLDPDSPDPIKARIYRDHVVVRFVSKKGIPLAVEERQRLASATDLLLSTPEQRAARIELPKVQETIRMLKISRSAMLSKLRGAYLSSSGNELRDKNSALRKAALRD